ncbi:MAG: peptidase T, partial [Oscillospiraceae bacterium]|nr:peptidase T [Oscillospiraceae bacterium]
MINEQRLIAEFLELTSFDSESLHEGPIRDHLARRLTALGLEVREDGAAAILGSEAGNLYARLEGEGESVLFSAHMDTVSPGRGKRAVVEGGTVRSDGTTVLGADDCAGLA